MPNLIAKFSSGYILPVKAEEVDVTGQGRAFFGTIQYNVNQPHETGAAVQHVGKHAPATIRVTIDEGFRITDGRAIIDPLDRDGIPASAVKSILNNREIEFTITSGAGTGTTNIKFEVDFAAI